jgi:hypothetical protein
MMIPGQWEPRPSNRAAVQAPMPVAAARRREPEVEIKTRRAMATWLEVSIVVAALVAAMFLAMWGSHVDPRIVMRDDPSEEVGAPVQHVVASEARCGRRAERTHHHRDG